MCSEYVLLVSAAAVFPSSKALKILQEIYEPGINPDQLNAALRKQGHSPEEIVEVVSQVALRQRARGKLGSLADSLLLTRQGLEQASRLEVARYHARKLARLGSVTDLGCGLGVDSIAFAQSGLGVEAVESDKNTAKFATSNLDGFTKAKVHVGTAEEFEIKTEAVFLDPARRDLAASGRSRKLLGPKDFSPSIDFALEVISQTPGGVKLAPGLPHELISDKFEAAWVSHKGDLVELSQWSTDTARAGRRYAVIVDGDSEHEFSGDNFEADVAPLGEFIYEPDPALIRSHLLGAFAFENQLGVMSSGIAYLTGREIQSPWIRGFRIVDELQLNEKELARYFAGRGIGTLEIKKRGVEIEPEVLRKKLKLKGSGAATLITTKVGGARKALVCEPVR